MGVITIIHISSTISLNGSKRKSLRYVNKINMIKTTKASNDKNRSLKLFVGFHQSKFL